MLFGLRNIGIHPQGKGSYFNFILVLTLIPDDLKRNWNLPALNQTESDHMENFAAVKFNWE